ncbi:hypothetical protein NQZ68_025849 [Dissostichus eleginoides]|nr:hypothetical protein NQZ68_025849 [Dissostichus eleginoides]
MSQGRVETSRRDGVAPRFGLGPASTGRVLLCGEGFTTAGACFPPVLVLLLRRPAPTCREEILPRLGPAFHLSWFCCCGGLLPPVVCCGVVCC